MRAGKCLTYASNGVACACYWGNHLAWDLCILTAWRLLTHTHTHAPFKLPLLPLNPELAPLLRISFLGETSMEQGNCLHLWECYQGSLFSRLATAMLWETLICAPLIVPLHQKQAAAKEQSLFVFVKKGGRKNWEAVGMEMSEWGSEWGRDSTHREAVSVEGSLRYRQIVDGEGKREREEGREGKSTKPKSKQTQVQRLLPPPLVYSIMAEEHPDSGAEGPQFKSWLCLLPITWIP